MNMDQVARMNSVMGPANQVQQNRQVTPHEAQQSFKTWLGDAINDMNQRQVDSQHMTERMARGENVDLHDVMITAQKASITLETTVEVRDKVIEAYQEIMRMQV
ncbi:flagellar hook-basal body complex protein FliE [Salisediminibacterium selenitireducens]